MGAYPEEDKEPMLPVRACDASPASKGGSLRDDRAEERCCYCIVLGVTLAILAFVWFMVQWFSTIQYSVAITGVSGLDPATDLRRQGGPLKLNPVFNLTIGISSPSAVNGGCIGPGTSIKVSYSHLRVPMAGGRAPEMCAGPWRSAGPLRAVAGGHDVALPGYLVDSLAEDMRRGDAVFEVRLTVLEGEFWKVVTCWARLGDATGAALNIPCRESTIRSIPQEGSFVPGPHSD